MQIESKQIIHWLKICSATFAENQCFLTDLDRDIGDADHGSNMNRGFEKVMDSLPHVEKQNVATILKNTGMIFFSSIGGASGPLYGTLFLRTATAIGNRDQISFEELIESLRDGIEGVISRGKAEPGDKTMCDVWLPVLDSAQAELNKGSGLKTQLEKMVETAEKSAVATIELQARKGKASQLGRASIGHQDPGATSSMMMIKALHQALTEY